MPKFDDVFIDHQWQLEQCIRIARDVCKECNVSWMDMISHRRAKETVNARRRYFYKAHAGTKASLTTIGKAIDKDHSTVMHGLKKYKHTISMPEDRLLTNKS